MTKSDGIFGFLPSRSLLTSRFPKAGISSYLHLRQQNSMDNAPPPSHHSHQTFSGTTGTPGSFVWNLPCASNRPDQPISPSLVSSASKLPKNRTAKRVFTLSTWPGLPWGCASAIYGICPLGMSAHRSGQRLNAAASIAHASMTLISEGSLKGAMPQM